MTMGNRLATLKSPYVAACLTTMGGGGKGVAGLPGVVRDLFAALLRRAGSRPVEDHRENAMHAAFVRSAIVISLFAVAACDEIAVAGDPVALADVRGTKSCIAAVNKQTGTGGAVLDTTVPIVELNRYVVNTAAGTPWTCITDENGKAIELVENRTG